MNFGHHYAWAAPTLLRVETFTISGQVLRQDNGEPIPDMRIKLFDENWQHLSNQFTNANGEYQFGSCSAGSYYIQATGQVEYENDSTNMYNLKYFDDSPDREDAKLISISADTMDVDFSLEIVKSLD